MIRQLTLDDLAAWRALRTEALHQNPEAYAGSPEDESDDALYRSWITNGALFCFFQDGQPIGSAGFYRDAPFKKQHKGGLYAVYVQPAHRGRNLGQQLVQTVLDYAATRVLQLHCGVLTTNVPAIKTYERCGFNIYATVPRSLKVKGHYYDEYLMVKHFS